jgi:WS/DGAT C-terminal domain
MEFSFRLLISSTIHAGGCMCDDTKARTPGTVRTGLEWGLDTGEAERERGAARRLNGLDAALVSNVPGPPVSLFVADARLVCLYPIGPIYDGFARNVTVLSREDSLDIGILGCRDHIPAVSDLAVELHRELEGLAALVGVDLEPAPNP